MAQITYDDAFGDELTKYPVRFAVPVFFGDSPNVSYSASIRNGTATLLRLNDKFLAVTCQHVLEGFRQHQSRKGAYFQVAHVTMRPEQHLVAESADLDLAVLDLTPFVGKARYLTEASFVCPTAWPPREVTTDDVICMAGFPGIWRDQISTGHLRFYSFSSGAAEVVRVREDQIVTKIQIQACVVQINHGKVLGSLGGLSGGPVFAWRKTPILVAELVGFIYEYEENFDLMLVRSAAVIGADGLLVT